MLKTESFDMSMKILLLISLFECLAFTGIRAAYSGPSWRWFGTVAAVTGTFPVMHFILNESSLLFVVYLQLFVGALVGYLSVSYLGRRIATLFVGMGAFTLLAYVFQESVSDGYLSIIAVLHFGQVWAMCTALVHLKKQKAAWTDFSLLH
jgi:lysylphosphatidylglycerol synthetase-like protein (DUF2156 family)